LLQVFFTECEKFLRHQSCSRHKLYELVCLCGSVCVSCKRTNSDVWLPIAKKIKSWVPPFIWGRISIMKKQNFTVFCKFNHKLNFLEITRDGKFIKASSSLLLFSSVFIRIYFSSHQP
jgi:hypothetical protein